jgi:hypothetical protein
VTGNTTVRFPRDRLLDRPGGRLLLSSIATRLARHVSHSEVDVKYVNGLWTHRIFPRHARNHLCCSQHSAYHVLQWDGS